MLRTIRGLPEVPDLPLPPDPGVEPGVREPRCPRTPMLSGGVALELPPDDPPADAIAREP